MEEKKKRVRRPKLQVLLAKAIEIETSLLKMAILKDDSLSKHIRSMIDGGFVPPVKKRETASSRRANDLG